MKRVSNDRLRLEFLGWQCRIRQISAREYDGQPLDAMRPRVVKRRGEVVMPAMIVLLIPLEPESSTAFFRFQVQKTVDPQRNREAGVKYLAADYYQLPELFSDELTAVFGAGSERATAMLKAREVLLDFRQFGQSYTMFCKVRRLGIRDAAREASLWQSRLFNPNVPNDAQVLGFRPDWKTAQAEPMPEGAAPG